MIAFQRPAAAAGALLKASDVLGEQVQSQLGDPAVHYRAQWIWDLLEERAGIGLSVPSPAEAFQLPYAMPFFLGAARDGAPESRHMHPHHHEVYLVMRGALAMQTWRGYQAKRYEAGPGDLLVIPPGTVHRVEWAATPGMIYVVKAPNTLTGDIAKRVVDGGI